MIVATGIANGLILFGIPAPGEFIATRYGQLLLVKLVLFALMLSLAAINRWRLAPAIGSAGEGGQLVPALRNLRRSLLVEGAAALAVLALVAWLGTMQPPAT
jgi:putative copper resistance protein D